MNYIILYSSICYIEDTDELISQTQPIFFIARHFWAEFPLSQKSNPLRRVRLQCHLRHQSFWFGWPRNHPHPHPSIHGTDVRWCTPACLLPTKCNLLREHSHEIHRRKLDFRTGDFRAHQIGNSCKCGYVDVDVVACCSSTASVLPMARGRLRLVLLPNSIERERFK